jgi:hypothetical protein
MEREIGGRTDWGRNLATPDVLDVPDGLPFPLSGTA